MFHFISTCLHSSTVSCLFILRLSFYTILFHVGDQNVKRPKFSYLDSQVITGDIGNKIYCVREVVTEIRDKATRERLQVLPYDLNFREPTTEAYQAVVNFSKKTGDFASLSAVDLRVLALVYLLEKENVGTDHIRTEPTRQVDLWQTKKNFDNSTQIAGFYLDNKGKRNVSCESNSDSVIDSNESCESNKTIIDDRSSTTDEKGETNEVKDDNNAENDHKQAEVECIEAGVKSEKTEITEISKTEIEENLVNVVKSIEKENADDQGEEKKSDENGEIVCDDGDGDDDDEEEEEEEEEGWITPDNLASLKIDSNDFNTEKIGPIPVACLTTDFAMQNVLLQMGLNVVSADGLLIKRARSYILRCYGCYKMTSDMTRKFCPKCGNATLKKVSVTVNSDGSLQYYISNRRPINTRGMGQSLPFPKGGKFANNPIVCEDQKEAKLLKSKRSQLKYNAFDPDYCAHDSPFAPRDLNSRYAARRSHEQGNKKGRGRRK